MSATSVQISLEEELLEAVDRAASEGGRDRFVSEALREKLARTGSGSGARLNRRGRLVREYDLEAQAALLDVDEERAWADAGLEAEASQWPQY